MINSSHFTGQPSYNQLLSFLDKRKISAIVTQGGYDRYVKRFDSYTHLVTLLYAVIQRYDSLREIVVGLLSNASRLQYLGIILLH